MEIKEKITKIINQFDEKLVERTDENRMILLGMLAGEHILLLGPPGTAKSLAARTICELLEGGKYFEYLLTKFTTPDEIFGPISITGLKQDKYERKTTDYLPEAHIAFLDEIFKASSAILNTLLTLINEGKFHNGNNVLEVPLISVIAASNESPAENDDNSLNALYDRFVIRLIVDNVKNIDLFKKIIIDECGDRKIKDKISLEEVKDIQKKINLVKIPERIWNIIINIKEKLNELNIPISDRRWRKIIKILKTSSITNGRSELDESDILLMKFLLYDNQSQIREIKILIENVLTEGKLDIEQIKAEIDEFKSVEVNVKVLYGSREIFSKNFIQPKVLNSETMKNVVVERINGRINQIKTSFNELNERRNYIQEKIKDNFWVTWVDINEFIKPIDNQIAKLNKTREEAEDFIQNIQNSELESKIDLQFICHRCNAQNLVSIKPSDAEEEEFSVSCKNCGSNFKVLKNQV